MATLIISMGIIIEILLQMYPIMGGGDVTYDIIACMYIVR
jgi:hypothetical protein